MINLYLVRHGQTDVNLMNQVQGQLDTHSLNVEGVRQVQSLVSHLRAEKMTGDKIFASPLKRAKETAAEIAKVFGLEVSYDDRLKEIDCGKCEGVEIPTVRAAVYNPPLVFSDALTGEPIHVSTGAELRDCYASIDPRYDLIAHPGGETKRAATDRAFKALKEILSGAKDGSHIWVVCHSTIIKLILARIAPSEASKKLECAEVIRLSWQLCRVANDLAYEGRILAETAQ